MSLAHVLLHSLRLQARENLTERCRMAAEGCRRLPVVTAHACATGCTTHQAQRLRSDILCLETGMAVERGTKGMWFAPGFDLFSVESRPPKESPPPKESLLPPRAPTEPADSGLHHAYCRTQRSYCRSKLHQCSSALQYSFSASDTPSHAGVQSPSKSRDTRQVRTTVLILVLRVLILHTLVLN